MTRATRARSIDDAGAARPLVIGRARLHAAGTMAGQAFGVIGLGVMGRNIALNIERNGFPVAVHNRTWEKTEQFLAAEAKGKRIEGARTPADFVRILERPRRILLMVQAGKPVDQVIDEILPLLEPGDVVIDGGNSHFLDTERRVARIAPTGIKFFGMGISGGEEGALWGPSLMPGGDRDSYRHLEPILTKIAAQTEDGPCVTYVGDKGAGHFVKMVHNGIEYGDMQLIAETYDVLRLRGGLDNRTLRDVFSRWNQGELQSFLIEITAKVVAVPDPSGSGRDLIDVILDAAGQKGTGRWTTQTALDLGVAIPTITAAVDARTLSAAKEERGRAAPLLEGPRPKAVSARDVTGLVDDAQAALYCSKICSYAQGMALIAAADRQYGYGIKLDEIARIWKGGCIIRAVFLDEIKKTFREEPGLANMLLSARFRDAAAARQDAWRRTLMGAVQSGLPAPGLTASIAYYDTYRSERLPANLIQAQRDLFGAHTYQRTDRPGTFHMEWDKGKEHRTDASKKAT
ncbi:6-phosphogluconate dehydrogenase, decarboxylating [Minicystis rosea]|nr:6-phosphogluconate dehydrogenase, decarboxylating [Minicystis rosea]